MKNLAPNIVRQRLLIEGFYAIRVSEQTIRQYFKEITHRLRLRAYGEPIVFSPGGIGKKGNQGYDAFIPLIDSGISLYVWGNSKFISCIIYTRKGFNENEAVNVTKDFFKIKEIAWQSF